jgi:hypothetical protein
MIVLLTFSFATRSIAGECDMQDLLVRAHHLAQVLEQQRVGESADLAAKQLRSVLNQISMAELAPRLRAAGLAADSADISAFLRTQKLLIDARDRTGGNGSLPARQHKALQDSLSKMQRLVPKMRCDDDKNWTPQDASGGSGRTTPTGMDGGGSDTALIAKNASAISILVFGLMALLIAMSMFLRRRAKIKRRRARRLPCALSCTISFIQDKRSNEPPTARRGKMCDISQLGAKVCVDESVPDTLNQCKLYSHGWSAGGRIIWRNAQCMGIAFKRALPAQELYHLVRLNRKLHAGKKNGTP